MSKPIDTLFDTVDWVACGPSADLKPGELYATHTGTLTIMGMSLDCAVLSNGARVFTEESLKRAFGVDDLTAILADSELKGT